MNNNENLNEEQREIIDSLTQKTQYDGKSKIRVFMEIPAKDRMDYFREHFLIPCVAAIVIIALCTFVLVRVFAPKDRPALYAAVLNNAVPLGEAPKLQEEYSKKIGANVIIDDYFDMTKDGMSKLQTMISNQQIDVVIAPHDEFKKLANYGYFSDLKTTLSKTQYDSLGKFAVGFHGFDDSDEDDPFDESGTGQGKSLPYGLNLDYAKRWKRIPQADDDALVGIVANTQQSKESQNFVEYLYQ